jgi:outer membrane receptor protein involved in Fe transport
MDVSSELVFVGDDGTTEAKGPSRRSGVDLSARYQLTKNIFADADVNISRGRFITKLYGKELTTDALIPLAPTLTSCGGLTYKYKNAEASFRYRFIADRPANEDNSIVAKGYTICDAMVGMNWKKVKARLSVENIFNIDWNEAQFATESRLFNESAPVDELHFTPGTPLVLKASITFLF